MCNSDDVPIENQRLQLTTPEGEVRLLRLWFAWNPEKGHSDSFICVVWKFESRSKSRTGCHLTAALYSLQQKQFPAEKDCINQLPHLELNHSVYISFQDLMMWERRVWRLALLHLVLCFSCTVNFAAHARWRLRRTSVGCLPAAWHHEPWVQFNTESWWTGRNIKVYAHIQHISAHICIAQDWVLLRCYYRGTSIELFVLFVLIVS